MDSRIEQYKAQCTDYSLIRLHGKAPCENGWQKCCHQKRAFPEIGFQPGDNAGIACGPASGIIAIDVDDQEHFEKACQANGWECPPTRTHLTGSGNRHLLYKYPSDATKYGNRKFKTFGFDIRGDGGQVVAPGSIHPVTGGLYTVEADVPIAEAPEWLTTLSKKGYASTKSPSKSRSAPSKALKGIQQGERDSSLFEYASSLRAKGMTKEEAEILVCQAAEECVPAFPRDEALAKVASAWRYPREFALTDLGNAERLVDMYGHDIRYCNELKNWLLWNGCFWIKDAKFQIMKFKRLSVRSMYSDAKLIDDDNKRKFIVQHAMRSESLRAMNAMDVLARSLEKIPVVPDELDADAWLYNVMNGTINLRTGEIRPHDPKDLITKLSPIHYDPNAACPRWLSFLDRIMGGNADLVTFLKRTIGYCLTGDVREQCLFFLHGTGANGKSTFLEVMTSLFRDYAKQADFTTFLMKANETVRNDIADLRGSRFVSAVEVEGGKRLAEALVKQVTGGDRLKARFLYSEYFEFQPTFKIFLAANHKPDIHGNDHAIWRRIKMIPFAVTIPEKERDPELKDKLRAELSGILRWAVEGCLEWQKSGLGIPAEVNAATESYRAEMDHTAAFIKECCTEGPTAKVKVKELQAAYWEWCGEAGEEQLEAKAFTKKLAERGFDRKRGASGYYWHGVGLAAAPAAA